MTSSWSAASSRSVGAAIADYDRLSTGLAAYAAKETAGGADPVTVAAVVVKAVLARRPRARHVVPRSYGGLLGLLSVLLARAADAVKLRQL